MTQTNYYEYQVWAQAQAADLPGMSYDSDTARFVVNGTKPFDTYLEAKWYYDYIYKFGGNPMGVNGYLPGVGIDFKNSRQVKNSVKADSFSDVVTHAATSNATMTDSDGLLKWRPHNLLTYSEQFDNVAWAKAASSITSNAAVAPDGTITADELVEDATISAHGVSDNLTNWPIGRYTFEVWAKAGERNHVCLHCVVSSGRATVSFDLSNGTIRAERFANNGSKVSVSIVSANNGYYKCSIQFDALLDLLYTSIQVDDGVTALTGDGCSYQGDGTSGIYIWGAHLYRSDLGGMVDNPDRGDSYVPTTSAAVYLPRRNHHVWNGSAWVNEGLLHESEARTNLVTYSQDFTDASWVKVNTGTLAIGAIGPDGETSAVTLVDSGLGGSNIVVLRGSASGMTVATSSTYTASAYFKADQLDICGVTVRGFTTPENGDGAYFNLTTGVVDTVVGAGISASITGEGNGWYRCSITFTTDAVDTIGVIDLRVASAGGGTVALDGTSSVLVYGAQFEAGSTPSSYIPTNGSTATRAAETLTIPSANLPWPSPRVIGEELVTNGTFDSDVSGWTPRNANTVLSQVSSQMQVETGAAEFAYAYQTLSATVGKVYLLSYEYEVVSGGGRVYVGDFAGTLSYGDSGAFTGSGSNQILFVAGDTTPVISFIQSGATTGLIARFDNISVREIDPLAVSIQMEGRVTYADENAYNTRIFTEWRADNNNAINLKLDTVSGTGDAYFVQGASGTFDARQKTSAYAPGVLIPFNIASRHGSTFINGAVDGTALTADTTPVALPDLSATDLNLGYDFMGTLKTLRIWADDIGNTGIAEASS